MTNKTLAILGAALVLAVYIWLYWLIVQKPVESMTVDPKYHGADAILTEWDGKVTAMKWTGKTYRVMWRRGTL